MANDITMSPLIVDTAGSGNVTTQRTHVIGVHWVGATTAGHQAIIQNPAGRVLVSLVANAANFSYDLQICLPTIWRDGFKVPTLGSGILYIYTREA